MNISQVCSLRALPQPEQELALERHAISYSGSAAVSRYGKSEAYLILKKVFILQNNF